MSWVDIEKAVPEDLRVMPSWLQSCRSGGASLEETSVG